MLFHEDPYWDPLTELNLQDMHEHASWLLWALNTQYLIKIRNGKSVDGVKGCGWVWGCGKTACGVRCVELTEKRGACRFFLFRESFIVQIMAGGPCHQWWRLRRHCCVHIWRLTDTLCLSRAAHSCAYAQSGVCTLAPPPCCNSKPSTDRLARG